MLRFVTGQLAGALSCININIVKDGVLEKKENISVKLLTVIPGVHISRVRSVIEIVDGDNNQSMLTQFLVS